MDREHFFAEGDIVVKNDTDFPMTHPCLSLMRGKYCNAPKEILPGETNTTYVHKRKWFPSSTYGSASWKIGDDHRVVVTWYIPFRQIFSYNTLAVGIYNGTGGHDKAWTESMYDTATGRHETRDNNLAVSGRVYESDSEEVTVTEGNIKVTGVMGLGHHAKIEITVKDATRSGQGEP